LDLERIVFILYSIMNDISPLTVCRFIRTQSDLSIQLTSSWRNSLQEGIIFLKGDKNFEVTRLSSHSKIILKCMYNATFPDINIQKSNPPNTYLIFTRK
jgi:hypothetical protein